MHRYKGPVFLQARDVLRRRLTGVEFLVSCACAFPQCFPDRKVTLGVDLK